ncbi:GrpB family protein [Bacillus sp. BGMRC 2118]|nr:GrpB family protein [Bacillus sp. BGMRC 2118]
MKVRLSDYNENWPVMFREETERLSEVFGDEIIKFEHFGSTAVPGLKAKPVIDMMCIVKDIERIDTYNDKMASLGYDVAGEWGIEGRRLFRKGGENRTHHIHVYQLNHPQIERHLVFRDYLSTHSEEVRLYTKFKEELASQFENTSEYSPAKKAFVSKMEKRALEWYEKSRVH